MLSSCWDIAKWWRMLALYAQGCGFDPQYHKKKNLIGPDVTAHAYNLSIQIAEAEG
jgi:hypothetical protein